MANERDKYVAYRPQLTTEQEQRIIAADTHEKRLIAVQEIAIEVAEQQFAASGAFNIWDGDGNKVRSDALPEEPDIAERFPGVDPRGKYSALDMKFAQRRDVIAAAIQTRGGEVPPDVDKILKHGKLQTLERQVDELARRQRTLTRAEKLCLSDEGAAELHLRARALDSDSAAVELDKALSGAEYLLGIRSGPLPQEIQSYLRDELGVNPDLSAEIGTQRTADHLEVRYPDFENQMRQIEFASPENWGKKPGDKGYVEITAEATGRQIERYTAATTGRTLDAVFRDCEAASEYENSGSTLSCMDRADYLIVDGKTPREIMLQEFREKKYPGYEDFDDFYAEKGHQRVAEIVGAALTTGARVTALIPDRNGNLSAEPVRLTQTGFEPDRFRPTTLNVWEKFWSKFGFYREKSARAKEEQADQARYEKARDRVLFYHKSASQRLNGISSKYMKDQFFADWKQKNFTDKLPLATARNYSTARSAWTSITTMYMLSQGYKLKDILDPGALRAEKQQAGSLVIDKLAKKAPDDKGDVEWEMSLFTEGARRFTEEINEMAKEYDLSDPKTYTSEAFRPMLTAMDVGFDAFQEIEHLKGAFETRGRSEEFASAKVQMGSYSYMTRAIDGLRESERNIVLQTPRSVSNYMNEFGSYLTAAGTIQKLSRLFAENPQKPFSTVYSKKVNDELAMFQPYLFGSPQSMTFSDAYLSGPKVQGAMSEAVISGKLLEQTKVGLTKDGAEVKMSADLFKQIGMEKPTKAAKGPVI